MNAESLSDLMNEVNSTLIQSADDFGLNSTSNISDMMQLLNRFVCGRHEPIFKQAETVADTFINKNDAPEEVDPNKYGSTSEAIFILGKVVAGQPRLIKPIWRDGRGCVCCSCNNLVVITSL